MKSENSRNIIRLVAAIYLGYMGIKLFNSESSGYAWWCPVVGGVFVAIAAFIAYKSVKGYLKGGQLNLDELNKEAEEEEKYNYISDEEIKGEKPEAIEASEVENVLGNTETIEVSEAEDEAESTVEMDSQEAETADVQAVETVGADEQDTEAAADQAISKEPVMTSDEVISGEYQE